MSQQEQEFTSSEETSKQAQDNEEIYTQQPYYWSTKPRTGDGPKDEHPATFEDSIPPYSYQAQEYDSAQQSEQASRPNSAERERPQPNRSNTQYSAYWQVPSWARPQQQKGNKVLRWVILIILAVVLIKPIIVVITIMLGAVGLVIGVALLAILLPILIILAILLAFVVMALIFLAMLGMPIRRGRFRVRHRLWR
ncbi:MAG TPA: hypothetical protein VFU49_15780 [Ktedonobacteraceae bacterium]|nr:hypothetical protein [Ktedonobacteraceae bacterium]